MSLESAPTWIVAGLGNPGRAYAQSRHNTGFLVLDELARRSGVKVTRSRFQALTDLALLGGQKVLLLKPQTYMNLSGQAVGQAAAFYKIPAGRVLILYDDISLDPGRIRVRPTGSAGGHNGIKSIIAHLGTQDFPRVKVGVGSKPHPDFDLADWVLSGPSAAEKKLLGEAVLLAADAAQTIIQEGCQAAMARFNGMGKA